MAGKHTGRAATDAANFEYDWSPRLDLAFRDGATGSPASNPHVSGTPDYNAYTAGATAGLVHEVPGKGVADVYAPIALGFNFTGAAGDYAETVASIDPETPVNVVIQFKSDSIAAATTLIQVSTNQFRLRTKGTTGLIQMQLGGAVITDYTTLAVTVGKEYRLDISQSGTTVTGILYNITDQTSVTEAQTLGAAGTGAGVMAIGGAVGGAAGNFNGVIGKVQLGWNGTSVSNEYLWSEQTSTAVADSAGSAPATLAAGSGSWYSA